MQTFNDDDLRTRAFILWQKAGIPAGEIDKFRYEAEKQMEDERREMQGVPPDGLRANQ